MGRLVCWLTRVGASSSGTNNLPLGNSHHPFSVLMAPLAWANLFWIQCILESLEGNDNPLQCSCLENPGYGGACWAAIYGVAQSWTRLKRLSSSSSSTSLSLHRIEESKGLAVDWALA